MAFSLTVTGATHVPGLLAGVSNVLTSGSPFRLEGADGVGGAEIVRLSQRSPQQSGVTDLGYRLQPRDLTLRVLFNATSGSALDLYRQSLQFYFTATDVVTLTAVRDDGSTRVLRCYAVEDVAIDLVPEDRAATLHRATIKLHAPNPLWQASSPTSVSTYVTQWWTAGGYIGTAQVREHKEAPANGNAWSWPDTNPLTNDWAVAVKTGAHTGGSTHYLWDTAGATQGSVVYVQGSARYFFNNGFNTTWPGGTAANYHVFSNESAVSYWRYWNGTAMSTLGSVAGDVTLDNDGAWRSEYFGLVGYWTPAITRAVIWGTPTTTQVRALAPYVLGSTTYGITGLNLGDVPAYPYITLRGPLTDPVLTNLQTGGSISLAGLTLGSADTAILDLRTGNKTLTDLDGNNLLGSVTVLPLSMADFYLAPAPEAPEGYNIISVTAGSVGTAAVVSLQHTNKWLSW